MGVVEKHNMTLEKLQDLADLQTLVVQHKRSFVATQGISCVAAGEISCVATEEISCVATIV